MPKIKVYELARDLNKTNKELLEDIKNMGIAVKSHMSFLDDESAAKIKTEILGEKMEMVSVGSNKKLLLSDESKEILKECAQKMTFYRESEITFPTLAKRQKVLKRKYFDIPHDKTGYTYQNLFGEYLKGVGYITIEEAYIRVDFQIYNFVRFCELVVKIGDTKRIDLKTGFDDNKQKNWLSKKLWELRKSLKKYGIEFEYEFSEHIHCRRIQLDNGWIIQIDRGLDIYKKPPDGWFSIGSCDFEMRPCHETNINIFNLDDIDELHLLKQESQSHSKL